MVATNRRRFIWVIAALSLLAASADGIARDGDPLAPIGGWSDGLNYFGLWNCQSSLGFDTVAKLAISPSGQLADTIWKDSLVISPAEATPDGAKLYFTIGARHPRDDEPVFKEAFATFGKASNAWTTTVYLDDRNRHGGVSSHDGTMADNLFNEYLTPGWGPFANKPGSQSKIPGVSESHEPMLSGSGERQTLGYPLVGEGPLGLTSVQSRIQNNRPDVNVRTCLHMNPSLFQDAEGRPAFVATLFTGGDKPKARSGCQLPNGDRLSVGNYVYRYQGPELGWQLDETLGRVGEPGNDAINGVLGEANTFIGTQWGGPDASPKLQIVGLHPGQSTDALTCNARGLHFAEASGNEKAIYFLADYLNAAHVQHPHDIFVAFRHNERSGAAQ